MNETFALLDCHSVCHAVKHKTKRLTFRGNKTGVIYGFLRSLLKLQEDLKPDVWVFAWDSRESVRRIQDPTYKADRLEKTPEEIKLNDLVMPQFELIRDGILPDLGFNNVFLCDGYEADDIIAQTIDYGDISDTFIMVTRDNDMWQLLAKNVAMYDHSSHKFYNYDDFVDEWRLQPEQWVVVKAVAGCPTDNVKGLSGIGEKTVAKFLLGELGSHTKAYKQIMDEENMKVCQRNVVLVQLPHQSMPALPPVGLDDKFNWRAFAELCETFGMRSFLKDGNWARWKEAFGESG